MNVGQIKPELDHNVYILGAGFSFDGGLPLIENFLEKMGECAEALLRMGREREAEAIQTVFQFRLRAAGAAYRAKLNVENIEELFSLASAMSQESLNDAITTAIAATLDSAGTQTPQPHCRVERIADSVMKEVRPTIPLYQLYAELLNGNFCDNRSNRNTVITFNYDTLLEDGLHEAGIPFTYGIREHHVTYEDTATCIKNPSSSLYFPVYKLHGSVNWSVGSASPDKVKIHGSYSDVRPADRILLVPPTWNKTFGVHLANVWENAVDALNQATRIIVLGFSMSPTDTHFKYLLIAGLRENISLRKLFFVNPRLDETKYPQNRKELEENLFSILRPELAARGVIELIPTDTMRFLLTSAMREKFHRNRDAEKLNIRIQMTPTSGFGFD